MPKRYSIRLISVAGALTLSLLQTGCGSPQKEQAAGSTPLRRDTTIRYAKRFAIAEGPNYTTVYLMGNRNNYDTTAIYLLCSDTNLVRQKKAGRQLVQIPCKRIAALSSIYATMFCELEEDGLLAAIDNIDYVNNKQVIDLHSQGRLKELAKGPEIDLEQAIALRPDIVFTYGMGNGESETEKKLHRSGVTLAVSVDHLEETPLARAEWIRFFAAFVDRGHEADSIFREVERHYLELKGIAAKAKEQPTVFNEIKYGDSWYMPGGKSYVARLLNDAAADYLWKDDARFGSLPLSFEQVFAKARNADFWINLSTLRTKKELLAFESRYAGFKAFQTGNLYNNTKIVNNKGYSIYWETGMIHPDRILSDLIQVFHPELKEQVNSELYYYEKLK